MKLLNYYLVIQNTHVNIISKTVEQSEWKIRLKLNLYIHEKSYGKFKHVDKGKKSKMNILKYLFKEC